MILGLEPIPQSSVGMETGPNVAWVLGTPAPRTGTITGLNIFLSQGPYAATGSGTFYVVAVEVGPTTATIVASQSVQVDLSSTSLEQYIALPASLPIQAGQFVGLVYAGTGIIYFQWVDGTGTTYWVPSVTGTAVGTSVTLAGLLKCWSLGWSVQFEPSSSAPMVAPPARGLQSSSNYFMSSASSGTYLAGPSVTIAVTQDLQWQATYPTTSLQGFNFQMNAYSLAPGSSQYAWQQYIVAVSGATIKAVINNFTVADLEKHSPSFQWSSTAVALPAGVCVSRGYQIQIQLATDATTGYVTGATFTVTEGNGTVLLSVPATDVVPAAGQAAVAAFELNFSGHASGNKAVLGTGAAMIAYDATNGLVVSSALPAWAGARGASTAEQTNTMYGLIATGLTAPITQVAFVAPPVQPIEPEETADGG